MARIRTIKPEFFTSEDIVSLSPLARLLYIALWCEADREGRLEWKPTTFKLRYLPGDNCDIAALCDELLRNGLVVVYGESKYASIPAFSKHQHLNPREAVSNIPEMTRDDACGTRADASNLDLHAQGGREGKGREGKEYDASHASASVVRKKPGKVAFKTWHATIPESQPLIPEDHAIFGYADKVGLPRGFLDLAWDWFEDRYSSNAKQYADWPAVFANAVKGNWGKLWWVDGDGRYALTSTGRQMQLASEANAVSRAAA